MYLNDYQHAAESFAIYHGSHDEDVAVYPFFGLASEAGEVCGKMARMYRGDVPVPDREGIKKELGDVLWNVSECCRQLGWSLDEVASDNLCKLADRQERDVLRGEGDAR